MSGVFGWASIGLAFVLTVAAVQVGTPAAADPAGVGSWTAPVTMPFVAIHATVVHDGRVLLFDRRSDLAVPPPSC